MRCGRNTTKGRLVKNNRLIVDDMEYVIDVAYMYGACGRRDNIPWRCNPFSTMSDKNSQWDYGHTNEDEGFHMVDGVDIIRAPRNGTVYRIVTGQ